MKDTIQKALKANAIREREAKVLTLRLTMTLKAIGIIESVTPERIRQIEARANRKLTRFVKYL